MADLTDNRDIDYIQKDFSSSLDAIISFANVNFGPQTDANRLWTNFNASSFSRNWAEIVSFVADIFFFYFDSQATQTYLQTATVRGAIKDIAKQFGFVPATATSASGNATFTVTGAVTIPRGFKVSASNGREFFVTDPITAVAAGDVTGNVLQGIIANEQFVAEGLQNEEVDLQGLNVIRDTTNLNPLDISPQVTVNGNAYTLVNTLIRQNGTDTDVIKDSLGNVIGGGGRAFTLEERFDGTPFIRFGDGIFGRKILAGENVTVIYRTGGGSAGNIVKETLTTLVDDDASVSSVTNNADFSGGADEQSIEQLRELIPASLRTLERAVAEQDYSDILLANFSEVFAASTEPNTTDPGIDLNIYVVPQGIGITNITDNTSLVNKLSSFIDKRKMVTVQFQILDAFGVATLIGLEIFITDTSSKSTVTQSIITALQEFFDLSTGGEDGSGIGFANPILIKDICNILDTIEGVERFEITRLSYRPRIDSRIIGLTTTYNSSDVSIFSNVQELEWLLGAAGSVTETSGTVLFNNPAATGYIYSSGTGEITYSFPVDLNGVAPGDLFRDGIAVEFTILAVDTANSIVTISTGQSVDLTAGIGAGGSIRNGSTSFESFKCFRKIRANATNLAIDTITDNNLDLSVKDGTGTAISARVLLDNVNIFVPGEFSTGDFYLVDASNNIWEIEDNDSNTLSTSITAVNDAAITSVASGDYKIVTKLTGQQVVFQGNVFNIQFNSEKTITSIGSQFSQIGTIGDEFTISQLQQNIGNLGVDLDLISYDAGTGELRLNSSPQLAGVSTDYTLIDSDGQLFNVIGVDNIAQPAVFYEDINKDTEFTLEGTGLGSQVAQGFKVAITDTYAVVSMNLKREGNILGNLTARIVNDTGGLPDLSSPVAVSTSINITDISNTASEKVVFSFVTPPTLTSGTQYHLVLNSDAAYASSEQSGVKSFDNTGLVTFTYNASNGLVEYQSSVNLTSVLPGHFFQDSLGTLFSISAVDDVLDRVTIATGQSVDTTAPGTDDDGAIIANDRILVSTDTSSPTFVDGEFSRFDGALWSDSTLGPSPSGTDEDAIFSIEGTKTITIESNLTPTLGPGATVSVRYYDDESQISLLLGISGGTITSATDVNALGLGTVASVPNRPVDTFVFRTSRFADDIVNLRFNEIPEFSATDLELRIFGGIE